MQFRTAKSESLPPVAFTLACQMSRNLRINAQIDRKLPNPMHCNYERLIDLPHRHSMWPHYFITIAPNGRNHSSSRACPHTDASTKRWPLQPKISARPLSAQPCRFASKGSRPLHNQVFVSQMKRKHAGGLAQLSWHKPPIGRTTGGHFPVYGATFYRDGSWDSP